MEKWIMARLRMVLGTQPSRNRSLAQPRAMRVVLGAILAGSMLLAQGSQLALAAAGVDAAPRIFVPFVSASALTNTGVAANDAAQELPPEAGALALVEFVLPNQAAIGQLNAVGADLAEYVHDNPDGTITINAFVTSGERAQYEAMGFPAGVTVEDQTTWDAARAEREASIEAERAAQEAAASAPSSEEIGASAFDPGGEVTTMRVDYFTNYAGRFLSVAARAALGTNSGGPTQAARPCWRTAWRRSATA